ncbi:hypothetical protein AGMMS50233_07230 [Endomicrobiia bacterium]|nr:hypothetical protein AGMMS50233_07230 [Endomicrobiia bacterium]
MKNKGWDWLKSPEGQEWLESPDFWVWLDLPLGVAELLVWRVVVAGLGKGVGVAKLA